MAEISTLSSPPPWCAYVSSSTLQTLGDDVTPMIDSILLTSVSSNLNHKDGKKVLSVRTVVQFIETSSSSSSGNIRRDSYSENTQNNLTEGEHNNENANWIQLNPLLARGFLQQQEQQRSTTNESFSSLSRSSPFVLNFVETGLQKVTEYNIPIHAQKIGIRKLNVTREHGNNNHNIPTICLSLIYTTLWTSNHSVSHHNSNLNDHITDTPMISKQHLQKALEGRIILQQSFLLLSIASSSSNSSTDSHYALVYIERVKNIFTNPHGNDQINHVLNEDDNGSHCIELGKHDSFSIEISNQNSFFPPPSYLKNHPSSFKQQKSKCPGYEATIEQIIDLASLYHKSSAKSASPSGVLLTGCAGIGKTQLALAVASKLSSPLGNDENKNNSRNQENNYIVKLISAKDIILSASTFMEESKLIDSILPQSFSSTEGKDRFSQILILDDLQEIFYPESSSNNESELTDNIDWERLAACNAVTCAIDKIISARESIQKIEKKQNYTFILGLYRTSSSSHSSFSHTKLTRVGRFEKILHMATPTEYQRIQILNSLFQQMNTSLSSTETQQWASALSPIMAGCVASDLRRMCKDALTRAQARRYEGYNTVKGVINDDAEPNYSIGNEATIQLTWEDVQEAARSILPSQLALLDVTIASRTNNNILALTHDSARQTDTVLLPKEIYYQYWTEFGGYKEMKEKLYRTVVAPWKRAHSSYDPNKTKKLSRNWQVPPPSGLIFHGPSGTGKTFAAHCLACALGLNVIKVRASDVLDKWLGGSEAAIRSLFARARSAAPCILFFDEIDAVATNREEDNDGDANCDVHSRVLSTMLNEMDGVSSTNPSSQILTNHASSVLVVAATNRLSAIDAALLRPGRLEEHISLGFPNKNDILDIIGVHFKKIPTSQDIDLNKLAESLHEMSATGADVEGIFTESCLNALRKLNESHNNHDGNKFVLTSESLEFAIKQWKGS